MRFLSFSFYNCVNLVGYRIFKIEYSFWGYEREFV